MTKDYVLEREGGYYISGTRVSLDSVVHAFLRGESPEGIVESFPALSMEQILGSLAFYLASRSQVDNHLRTENKEFESLREQAQQKNPALYAKLTAARQKLASAVHDPQISG